jgi:hypothetical protein
MLKTVLRKFDKYGDNSHDIILLSNVLAIIPIQLQCQMVQYCKIKQL